jgi:hypothetical protein
MTHRTIKKLPHGILIIFWNKKQVVVEPKVSNPSVHMVDVNMAITKSNVIEKQMFKHRKPIKEKCATDWEEE